MNDQRTVSAHSFDICEQSKILKNEIEDHTLDKYESLNDAEYVNGILNEPSG